MTVETIKIIQTMKLIAQSGRTVVLGLASGTPGDGAPAVVESWPAHLQNTLLVIQTTQPTAEPAMWSSCPGHYRVTIERLT